MAKLYELEDKIMKCWNITEELDLLAETMEGNDRQMNIIIGLRELYNLKFEKLFNTYEKILKEKT